MFFQLRAFASERDKQLSTMVIVEWKSWETALQFPFDYSLQCKKFLYTCASSEMCLMILKTQGQLSISYFELAQVET